MKRLFLLITILVLVISSVYAEFPLDNHPDEFVGCWAVSFPAILSLSGNITIVLILNNDGSFTILLSNTTAEEEYLRSISTTGRWTFVNDMIVFQTDGTDTYGVLKYHDDLIWFDMDSFSVGLSKIPEMELSQIKYNGE